MFLQNKPCPECGYTENEVVQIGGFTNWDEDEYYRITCGNKECGHSWEFSQ